MLIGSALVRPFGEVGEGRVKWAPRLKRAPTDIAIMICTAVKRTVVAFFCRTGSTLAADAEHFMDDVVTP